MTSVISLDKLEYATIKNRIESAHLHAELNRIERQRKDELRMSNNEIQRFRTKYSKPDVTESSDVKMYETHNPGFCFRRNGEHRNLQPPAARSSIDFKHLHFLIFTDGEVDIEKLVCLHLLCFHETRQLTPPKQLKNTNLFLKRDSPVEQLIERSASFVHDKFTTLPTYILTVSYQRDELKLKDSRLNNRLLVNETILSLITTVLQTLETSNPEKFALFHQILEDASCLKRIFTHSHVQDFIIELKNHALLHSCSCFILTGIIHEELQHLEIKTATGSLEELLNSIRSNVLQLSNRLRYRSINNDETQNVEEKESEDKIAVETVEKQQQQQKNKVNRALSQDLIETRKKSVSIVRLAYDDDEEEEDDEPKFRRSNVNFIAKNIASVSSFKRGSIDINSNNKSAISIKRPSSKSVSMESKQLMRGSRLDSIKEDDTSDSDNVVISKPEQSQVRIKEPPETDSFETEKMRKEHENHIRVHLKQTTCLACMQKWKQPLPKPKVSLLNRSNILLENIGGVNGPSLNSRQRLGMLIEREEYKLNSMDRKYSTDSSAHSVYMINKKHNFVKRKEVLDLTLNVFHLEKIKQEIREKEAEKKLEKFLCAF